MARPKYNKQQLTSLYEHLKKVASGYDSPSALRKARPSEYAMIIYHKFDILLNMPRKKAPAYQNNNNNKKWSAN